MCGIKSRNLSLLLVGFLSLCSPQYLLADVVLTDAEYSELMTLIQDSKEKEKSAEEKIESLQTELKSGQLELRNWRDRQSKISESQAKDLAELSKYLKKLRGGPSLGIDAGVLAVPDINRKLQLGMYTGISFNF